MALNQAVFGLSSWGCGGDVNVFFVKEFPNISSNDLLVKVSVEFSDILPFDLGDEFPHGEEQIVFQVFEWENMLVTGFPVNKE